MRTFSLVMTLCFWLAPQVARAQGVLPPDVPDTARMHIGPVAIQPRFEIREAGVDSNVFNEADGPQQDFTIVVRPALEARMRFGGVRLLYRSSTDAVYFQKFKDQRALNNTGEFRAELRFARFIPYFSTLGLTTQDRPGQEIDLRAERALRTFESGVTVALLSRTGLTMSVKKDRSRYAPDQQFGGEDLAVQLNSTQTVVQGGLKLALTPFTLLTLTGAREETEFELSPDRNSTSVRFGPQLDFDPQGVITGSASLGFRRFTPSDPDVPAYKGAVARLLVAMTLPETRVALRFLRDVSYSYRASEPYYLSTGGGVVVTRRIAGPFDVQLSGALDRLDYQARISAVDTATLAQDETLRVGGAGVGYRLPSNARIGLNFELAVRDARQEQRSYTRQRIFGSFTYGFQQ